MNKQDLYCAKLLMLTGRDEAQTIVEYFERIILALESNAEESVIGLTVNSHISFIKEELKHVAESFEGCVRITGIEPEEPEEISDKLEE